jgi:hypothetical protein
VLFKKKKPKTKAFMNHYITHKGTSYLLEIRREGTDPPNALTHSHFVSTGVSVGSSKTKANEANGKSKYFY